MPGERRTDDPEPKSGRRCLRGRSAYEWQAGVRGHVRQMTKAVKELASLKEAVIAYVKEKYGASPENLWMRYPESVGIICSAPASLHNRGFTCKL